MRSTTSTPINAADHHLQYIPWHPQKFGHPPKAPCNVPIPIQARAAIPSDGRHFSLWRSRICNIAPWANCSRWWRSLVQWPCAILDCIDSGQHRICSRTDHWSIRPTIPIREPGWHRQAVPWTTRASPVPALSACSISMTVPSMAPGQIKRPYDGTRWWRPPLGCRIWTPIQIPQWYPKGEVAYIICRFWKYPDELNRLEKLLLSQNRYNMISYITHMTSQCNNDGHTNPAHLMLWIPL